MCFCSTMDFVELPYGESKVWIDWNVIECTSYRIELTHFRWKRWPPSVQYCSMWSWIFNAVAVRYWVLSIMKSLSGKWGLLLLTLILKTLLIFVFFFPHLSRRCSMVQVHFSACLVTEPTVLNICNVFSWNSTQFLHLCFVYILCWHVVVVWGMTAYLAMLWVYSYLKWSHRTSQ